MLPAEIVAKLEYNEQRKHTQTLSSLIVMLETEEDKVQSNVELGKKIDPPHSSF
jgi:hypothetical protein